MTFSRATDANSQRVPFITWEHHRRSEGLAREMNLELIVLTSERRGLLRYLALLPRTALTIARLRASWIVVQCPSIVLAVLAVLLSRVLRFKLAIDAHNEAVEPFIHDNARMRRLTRWLHRRADLIIVTNEALADIIRANGGTPFVLPDPLPVPAKIDGTHETDRALPLLTVICTYAPDEPLEAVVAASKLMQTKAQFALTGNERRGRSRLGELPTNLRFTGFLPEPEYWQLLARSTVVVDLSMMPHCLVCGAYEALSLGVPLLLTDDPAGREVFGPAALFTRNDAAAIAGCMDQAIAQAAELRSAAADYRLTYQARWQATASQLIERLHS
ncbi:MAG TPA: glycosyltransferase [Steroidobacter sp.]|uniref:glycosyltransferase n=1 Tax=Steroidobacter sp. TaxID=1978227 RepID=UPI002ED9DBD3